MTQPTLGPGLLVDTAFLQRQFKAVGKDVQIYLRARIDRPDAVTLGDACIIDEDVFLFAGQGIDIGHHVHFAFASSISGGGRCVVDNYVSIGVGVRLITGTDNIDEGLTNPTVPQEARKAIRSSIHIGDHAVVFTGSIILPGVNIGEGAVVSAGSLVHHDLKPWTVYGGNPLTPIKVRDKSKVLDQLEA